MYPYGPWPSIENSQYEFYADEHNRQMIKNAVPRALSFDLTIQMKCFNEKEANDLRTWATAKFPDVKFHFTWMKFKGAD